jgi:hypothetical protein
MGDSSFFKEINKMAQMRVNPHLGRVHYPRDKMLTVQKSPLGFLGLQRSSNARKSLQFK